MPRSRSLAELVEQNRSNVSTSVPVGALGSPNIPTSQAAAAQASGESGSGSGGGGKALAAGVEALKGGATAGKAAGAAAGATEAGGILKLLGMFCWVAAEYYPRGTIEWFRIRNWVLDHPHFAHWYCEHGEWLASQIHRRAWLRALITASSVSRSCLM